MIAEDFILPDQNGKEHRLSDYRGKWVVLYFYPKDDTPGCTIEACSFRDNMQQITEKGVVVLGVSADSSQSHQKFIGKHHLNFILLADQSTEMIKKYNAWGTKSIFGIKVTGVLRMTYLINPEGEIAKIYKNVNPKKHIAQLLQDFSVLKSH